MQGSYFAICQRSPVVGGEVLGDHDERARRTQPSFRIRCGTCPSKWTRSPAFNCNRAVRKDDLDRTGEDKKHFVARVISAPALGLPVRLDQEGA